jgi:hypothetical protein
MSLLADENPVLFLLLNDSSVGFSYKNLLCVSGIEALFFSLVSSVKGILSLLI